MRVWLVRHGATTAPPGVAIGATDPPLSDQGYEQAGRLAAELAHMPLARVLSSDLKRALATADAIATPHRLVVESTPALREIDFGAWEGRSLADLWSEEPQAAKAWEDDIRCTPSTFGEDLAGLERRVQGFWRHLRLTDGGELAIVGHRCSLAVLRARVTGESLEEAFSTTLEMGAAVGVLAKS
ncbi:MAG TPA: histidine phosphatase family protein [Candidatus Dormibacteraeota bacterium]|nr:histidine phosphatase family protein [Candidatus Dormibacteraeota bacterium]